MKQTKFILVLFISILLLGIAAISACGFFGVGGGTERWKEEVRLSDGRIIVVEREMLREGGGGEWAHNRSLSKPKQYVIRFIAPAGSSKMIEWRSEKISYSSTWPEVPLIFDLESGKPVVISVVYISDACEVYIKYIYQNDIWVEEKLPDRFKQRTTNLYLGLGKGMPKFINLKTKRTENDDLGYRKSIRQVGPNRKVCG